LAWRVLIKIVYVLAWRTLNLVVVLFRSDQAAAAEALVLPVSEHVSDGPDH
jgi:hypothetical protein